MYYEIVTVRVNFQIGLIFLTRLLEFDFGNYCFLVFCKFLAVIVDQERVGIMNRC